MIDYSRADITEASMRAEMVFFIPVNIRQDKDLQLSVYQVVMSLSNRVSGLPRWQV